MLGRVEPAARLKLPAFSAARPPPPPDLDPFSASEEADEMDPAAGGEDPEENWGGEKALLDFPPRGTRRRRQAAFLEPAPHARYVEDARIPIQHRQVALQMAPLEECACPEPLAKGTLVAMLAVLAFLGFFSTSVLLVVAVCLLRLVERQRKSGKDANAMSNRPLPPLPPPRPERVYLSTKPAPGYERLTAASPRTPEGGAYLSASELHPGPRSYQKMGVYQAAVAAETESKNLPESEYITVNPAPGFSSPVPPKTYSGAGGISSPVPPKIYSAAGAEILSPGKNEEEIYGSPEGTKPEKSGEASPIAETPLSGRENHIYEEVE
ncbi:Hypothetical predicted protein [Podarcis lilfordi]|uniref:Uncharacterized protein n=1 Tax=Podarcis lilfordi TaxID=74358 RepID=A0AA35LDW1_9SAUR|nr:Hypothetical predicted protein [Podarcis lilfordi]